MELSRNINLRILAGRCEGGGATQSLVGARQIAT
jgi:hypothetical protein